MKEADIILAKMTQANGQIKSRPAVILREMPKYKDLLVCGISSQLKQRVNLFDEIISPQDPDFTTSNLITTSLIRLSFLTIISRGKIAGSIGSISPERHQRLLKNLSDYLVRNTP